MKSRMQIAIDTKDTLNPTQRICERVLRIAVWYDIISLEKLDFVEV